MAIIGIDAVTYGLSDLTKGKAFYSDFGLNKKSATATRAVFDAQDGSQIILKKLGDKTLPPAFQRGNGVREVTWGVSSKADLSRIKKEMLKDREVIEDKDGTLHFMDPAGVPLAFRKTQRKKLKN